MIIRLINLLIKGAISANTPTERAPGYDHPGFHRYRKDVFDEHYQFPFYKYPIGDLPTDIGYYFSQIGHVTLMKKQVSTMFEIYETNLLSENELALNVKLSYADFVMTGIASRKASVVTRNEFFVLCINKQLERFEIKSSIQQDPNDKLIKSDFGEYLIKYLIKNRVPQEIGNGNNS